MLSIQLVFDGKCEEAFNFYAEVLGGKIVFILRKGDDPNYTVGNNEKDNISHAILATDNLLIGGNDYDTREQLRIGNNTKISLILPSNEEVKEAYDQLSQGATIHFPLQKINFTGYFGELTDRYGISWIVMTKSKNMG